MPYIDDLRLREKPLPKPPPSEDDSDCSSPPERRVESRVSLHISVPENARHSTDRPGNPHRSEKALGAPIPIINERGSTSRLYHDGVLNEKSNIEQPAATNKVDGLSRPTTDLHEPSSKDMKLSLIHRVASKLRIAVPAPASSSQPMASAARAEANHSSRPPRSPRTNHNSPTLPNSFVSRENREAALRERGLRPPRKDLSEQEREADERLGPAPLPVHEQGESAASKIKEEWLFMNRSSFPT